MLEKQSYQILLVEDNPIDRHVIEKILNASNEGFELTSVGNITSAKQLIVKNSYDVIISDYELGDGNGMQIIYASNGTPVILMTGQGNEEIAVDALKAGAYDYIIKDFKLKNLKLLPLTLKKVIAKSNERHTNQILLNTLENITDRVCITDLKDEIIFANKSYCDDHKKRLEDIKGLNINSLDQYVVVNRDPKENFGSQSSIQEISIIDSCGKQRFFSRSKTLIQNTSGKNMAKAYVARDITRRKRYEEKQKKLLNELKKALANVRMLSGLLPICSSCKKIRDDKGEWNVLEKYIRSHSEAEFSHSVCPECAKKLYPEFMNND